MIGVWNAYLKPPVAEIKSMFNVPSSSMETDKGSSIPTIVQDGLSYGEKDPVLDSGWDKRQRNRENKVIKTIAELYLCACEVKPEFDKIMCAS
jgi:hypothetical protein